MPVRFWMHGMEHTASVAVFRDGREYLQRAEEILNLGGTTDE